ncbi:MAG: hypothetical protein HKN88_05490 [Gammaproteobacteria bacterium]|nr:hypothetical protein [Gammaproteobacteria bacterium]NNC97507.1 hypothetical protein [Gammaproteobacteria bacterium]NNM14223.1 hypothetical protein [Gammaproteobacteria bacterium]
MKKNSFTQAFILFITVLAFSFVHAEEAMPPPDQNVAEAWYVTPKAGMASEFEQAFKDHMKFRSSKNDPRHWDTYTPYVGDKMGFYVVRTCCVKWADLDTYMQWQNEAGTQKHWNENVDPFVASYSHAFFKMDFENSNWGPGVEYNFVGVTQFKPKRGSGETINALIKEMSMHAKEGGWPRNWSWSWKIGGKGGLSLVTPMKGMANMKQDPPFGKFLAEKMKSEKKAKALLDNFNAQFEYSKYMIAYHRKDMSMKMKAK